MPLFQIAKTQLLPVPQTNFAAEKALQSLVEKNLGTIFNCRLVSSEYPTGARHAGRIDTLALSEDNNPVIIEYKRIESSDLINQSLFYLSWLSDHRGDFELAVQRALGSKCTVDWADIRVICIAPNYRRYDLHAVQMMDAAIELWAYRLFGNSSIYLEEVLQRSVASPEGGPATKARSLSAAKKTATRRPDGSYTFDEHLAGRPANIRDIALSVHEFMLALDPAIQAAPKKFYVAYKVAQNLVCMEVQTRRVILYLKLDPRRHKGPPEISRDVTQIGHYGTGNLELSLRSPRDVEAAKPFIELAYQQVGS